MVPYEVRTEVGRLIEDALGPDRATVLWGACPVTFSSLEGVWNYAAVFLFPYKRRIAPDCYSENAFHTLFDDTKAYAAPIKERVLSALAAAGIDRFAPEATFEQVDAGTSPISAKYVGVQAGLGWIGRNDLLITPQFGPRFQTWVLMVNDPVDVGRPTRESRCGSCDECVRHCPFHAIKGGLLWANDGTVSRDDLIDFTRCRDGRERARKKLGRRLSCGRCMTHCPYGMDGPRIPEETHAQP